MKIISFYQNEKKLIRKAAGGDRQAQRFIYERHAPTMMSVCRQYVRDVHFAEDVMITGFTKVFKHLDSFGFQGSFEGWIRKIMTREAISFLRKRQFVVYDEEVIPQEYGTSEETDSEMENLQALLDQLPEGYRMVFVLYAVEGYKHQEIAEMLEISESTSKSQFFKARKRLQEMISEQKAMRYGTRGY